jgi:hypothetical protein
MYACAIKVNKNGTIRIKTAFLRWILRSDGRQKCAFNCIIWTESVKICLMMETAGEKRNGDVLNSWKEIAAYLDRNIRTCQRWERDLGLPVYRVEQSPRAAVFAYKDEIDNWLKTRHRIGIAQSQKSKKTWILIVLISAAGLVAAVLSIVLSWRDRPNIVSSNPIRFIQEGDRLLFLNAMDRFVWDVDLSRIGFTTYGSDFVSFADIDQDGKNEVALALRKRGKKQSQIILFENNGDVFREGIVFWPNQSYADKTLRPDEWDPIFVRLVDIVGDEKPEIVSIWKNDIRFPSAFVVYDLKGREITRYNNTGHLSSFRVFDSQQGQKKIYLAGTNNLLNGDAIIAVLDSRRLRGGTMPPYAVPEDLSYLRDKLGIYVPENPVRADYLEYIRIKNNNVTIRINLWIHPRIIDVSEGDLRFCFPGVFRSRFQVTLDSQFVLKEIIPTRSMEKDWNRLFMEGETEISLSEYITQAPRHILYWKNGRWNAVGP